MATVYAGYQEAVDRRVAIKVLPPHPGLDAQFVDRFQLEARTIARLQHPHILPVYDYGTEGDVLYLVMAYIDGGSVEDYVADGAVSLSVTSRVLTEIAGAVDYAHRQNVIHRDIKPGNILLDSEGHALLADFGIAKLAESSANLTGTGVVGTPAYMSPEQAQGLPLDGRSDVYSLGVVIFQMLTGTTPFPAPTLVQVMLKVMQEPAPNVLEMVEGLPAGLGPVMERVMAKDPDERYQTTTDFANAFKAALHTPAATTEQITAASASATVALKSTAAAQKKAQMSQPASDSQTIIVQQGLNPLVLLGGFAIIAVALVAIVLLVVSNDGGSPALTATNPPDNTPVVAAIPTPEDAVTPVAVAQSFGRVSYSNVAALGDAVIIRADGLNPLPGGRFYIAWLLNTTDETYLNVGQLIVDSQGSGSLTFTDPEGRLLPSLFNAVVFSLEDELNMGDTPNGEIAYSGFVPPEVPTALREILVASVNGLGGTPPDVEGGSLLEGAITEAEFAAQHAELAARASTVGGMLPHAEHTINILRGEEIDYDNNGVGENPGRGIGVYVFADFIEAVVDNALNAPGSTESLEINAENIRVCLDNTRIRADRVGELALELLATDTLEAVTDQFTESVRVSMEIQTGFDLNENGIIEPFEGECGLEQIDFYGLQLAVLTITRGDLD